MSLHEVWHVLVLAVTLFAGAALALVLLAPLIFEATPSGLQRARPYIWGAVAAAAVLLLLEWQGVHGGWI
ncbi:MAG: hypothetical protein M3198_04965 [Actinomycetota bacterium]|nr:hypothetical protein [Actinomycetota bacterium]